MKFGNSKLLQPTGGDECLTVGSSKLPTYFLPKCVTKFAHRDIEKDPVQSDDEYFEAVLACETARLVTHRLRKTLRANVCSTKVKPFAQPESPFFNHGRDLSDVLADLTLQLDNKREIIVQELYVNPPLIESFLDKMEATELQCKVFRHVLVAASGIIQPDTSDTVEEVELAGHGTRSMLYSVSMVNIQDIFADDLSLNELMSWTSVQSKWVKEQIYEQVSRPRDPISMMDGTTIAVLMGGYDCTTVSQFQELPSAVLQDTLREHGRFKQTETGKAIVEQHGLSEGRIYYEKEDWNTETVPFADVFNSSSSRSFSLKDKLAESGDHEGRIFNLISDLQEEEKKELEKEKADRDEAEKDVEPASMHDSKQDDEDAGKKEAEFGPYNSEMDYFLASKYRGENLSKDMLQLEKSREAERLEKKLKRLREKITTRLRATKMQRNRVPRLEQLCDSLHLDQFERFVLLDLIRTVVNPFVYDQENDDGHPNSCVATYIERFTHSLEEKMHCRKYFYKSSTLVKEAIITVYGASDFMTDLNMASVILDRRIFDWLIALDTEFSELVEGSHLYTPDVDLDDVILPKNMKHRICEAALRFDEVKDMYHSLEIDKKITYGLGQVILFYGASGTGKTMMANALGAKMKKKILLVNFPSLGDANASGEIIKFLFREARIKKSILFFDECESLFLSRDLGNYSINTILSELERFNDLCILATNRPMDLDEAMYRRVSLAVEFRSPDHMLREKIWKTLRPPNLQVDEDVNYKELARKYELAGGFIKNAWLSSVALMVNRGDDKVNLGDLEQAAKEQVIGRLNNENYDRRVVATCGVESVITSPRVAESLKNIVQHTKAQSVLFGQWGFDKIHRTPSGVSALFCGMPGTGKTMAAEAISFDLGSPLMVVNSAELVNKYVGETGKNIESVFREAQSKGAVLVFDEGEGLFGMRGEGGGDPVGRHDTINVGLLLQHIESFTGVCIVVTNQRDTIDEAFFRRFRYVLNFEPPSMRQREKLWKSIVPKECPLAADVSLSSLARRYELCGGGIKSALLRAATRAALRHSEDDCVVLSKDLEEACEEEVSKRSSGIDGCSGFYS